MFLKQIKSFSIQSLKFNSKFKIDCHTEFRRKLDLPPYQAKWLFEEKTWEKRTRRRIDLYFQRHERQYRACEVRRWKKTRHKPCQRSLSLNVRSENEKAERGVWKWKWSSVAGREKKDPKNTITYRSVAETKSEKLIKNIPRRMVFQEKTIAFWSLINRI